MESLREKTTTISGEPVFITMNCLFGKTYLFNFGYRYDLKVIAQDGMDDELHQLRKTSQDMPRFKISANQEYFELFFSLVESMNSEVSQAAWSLIKTFSTSPILY